jgi:hypothetical protein
MNWKERVAADPLACHGKACSRGHQGVYGICRCTLPRTARGYIGVDMHFRIDENLPIELADARTGAAQWSIHERA